MSDAAIRCPTCGRVLGRRRADGGVEVRHRGLEVVVWAGEVYCHRGRCTGYYAVGGGGHLIWRENARRLGVVH